jgi:hypothetical protein
LPLHNVWTLCIDAPSAKGFFQRLLCDENLPNHIQWMMVGAQDVICAKPMRFLATHGFCRPAWEKADAVCG